MIPNRAHLGRSEYIKDFVCITYGNVPSPRRQQTSTLVDTRLYFFGGAISSTRRSNEVCPIDNSTVFLIGGRTWIDISATTDYYSYTSSVFTTRNEIQAVIDNNGKIFVFGGINYNSSTFLFYNDMNILDITTMTWSTKTQSQSILTYVDYTAILLPNGLIVYIGGRSGSSTIVSLNNISQVQIFDTKSYTWSTKPASGSTIASRVDHSAVLTQDGDIIIYGGSTLNHSAIIGVFSDIAVLNTNSWVWSVPSISGTNAPPLTQHSAALYKNYMILAFGANSASTFTNNIYILDIQNYTWVTTFNVPTTTNQAKQMQSNSNSSTDQANNNYSYLYIGIGIGAGVVILTAVSFIIGFVIYKNRHKEEIIATPGTFKNDQIHETHMSTVYTPGIPPPETSVQ
ncbi:galactose oxidase [Gigaspora margarita]|uniref:Galactose oxidase n=1 Tax=Gigaspora margarita TaxID=4874 RepID=A0A8H3X7B9_GIGMA|nr:galactose oxidase [Gigaspora margarita]